jgi:hypothetical protein
VKTLHRLCLTISGVALLLAGLAAEAPQGPATASGEHTSAISGVVFDASTKQPVPRAVVALAVFGASSWRDWQRGQLSDERGRFAFVNLAPGDYDIVAQKVGYFDGRFGGDGIWDAPPVGVRLASGEWFSTADVPLTRPGSLSGTVRDEPANSISRTACGASRATSSLMLKMVISNAHQPI